MVAQRYVGVLIGDFQQALANSSTLGFAQPREFLDDFGCAHDGIIAPVWRNSSGNFSDKTPGNSRDLAMWEGKAGDLVIGEQIVKAEIDKPRAKREAQRDQRLRRAEEVSFFGIS